MVKYENDMYQQGFEVEYDDNIFSALGHQFGLALPSARFEGLFSMFSKSFKVNPAKANRFKHIFGKSEHVLESLINKFGSQEKAFNAVQKAANRALKAGELVPNAKGVLPGVGKILNVDGMSVRMIGGIIKDGKVVLSSFSRKGL